MYDVEKLCRRDQMTISLVPDHAWYLHDSSSIIRYGLSTIGVDE